MATTTSGLPFLLRLELHNQIYDNKSFPFRESE